MLYHLPDSLRIFTPHNTRLHQAGAIVTGSFRNIYPYLPGMWLDVTIGDALNKQGVVDPDESVFGIEKSMLDQPIAQKKVQIAIAVSAAPESLY